MCGGKVGTIAIGYRGIYFHRVQSPITCIIFSMAPVTDQKEKKFKYTSLIGKMEKDAAAYGLATSNKKRKEKKEMEKDSDLQKFIRLPNSSKLPISLGFITIFLL